MAFDFLGFEGNLSVSMPLRTIGVVAFALELIALLTFAAFHPQRRMLLQRLERALRNPQFLILLAIVPLTAQLLLIRFNPTPGVVTPGLPLGIRQPAFSLFGDLPWFLAAGLLGPWQAAAIAGLTGLIRALWETHSILTPLHMVFQALIVTWLLRQNFVERPGQVARIPLVGALLGGLIYGLFRSFEHYAYSGGSAFDGLDFTFGLLGPTFAAAIAGSTIAGGICTWLRSSERIPWYSPSKYTTGPYNRSLAARLVSILLIVGMIASVVLVFGDWVLAQRAARDLLERQMLQTAEQAAGTIPYFIQSGRSLNQQVAEEFTSDLEANTLTFEDLQDSLRRYAFHQTLVLYDRDANALLKYPEESFPDQEVSFELGAAVDATLIGIPQEVVLIPTPGANAARLAFLSPIQNESEILGVVVGVVDMSNNPYIQPLLEILVEYDPGSAFITDSSNRILIHPESGRIMGSFEGSDISSSTVILDRAPDGTRRMLYTQEIEGYPWKVVLVTPQSEVQRLALRIATNLVAVILVVGLIVLLVIYLISRRLTQPLRMMATVAQSIARGNLAQPVVGEGEDEIGQLAVSFERMRRRLKSRLDEMGLLLQASQRVASSFNLAESLPPILEGLRELTGADLVHLALENLEPADLAPEVYGAGGDPGNWGILDPQILSLTRSKGRFTLENPTRAKAVLEIKALDAPVEALTSVPLLHEDRFVGALWLGYQQPHVFTPDEVRLLTILTGQLGIAVSNTRLYHRVEQERSRLTAVLETTPDAVILIDQDGRISLANPAADSVLTAEASEVIGLEAQEAIRADELKQLLADESAESHTVEIRLDNGQVLFASISDISGEEADTAGRVCVLWDITHYKKLDTLKSEFVSTVSHDLRAPLTLMRGYATMLTMVGAMNEQQKEFVSKILTSADQMGNLIENLLDLSRIEAGVGLELERIKIEDLIEAVVQSYRPQAVNKQISLELDLQEELEPVEVDPTLIRQAIANLVDNAIKYTSAGGMVRISASQQKGYQFLSVKDTGFGIAPTDQARLFERFYRARRQETLNIKGTGLGLAIVKSIVQQHGGEVSVESRLGEGSTFSIHFPIRQEALPEQLTLEGESSETDHNDD
jgi:PAS domain S-box-containing protein